MTARFYDGRSARALAAEVTLQEGALVVSVDGNDVRWRMPDLSVQVEAGEARISNKRDRDARLVMPEAQWRLLAGDRLTLLKRRRRNREIWLVGGLAATAVGVVLFVTVGVPALSGPLARATPVDMEQRMGRNFDAQIGAVFPRCKNPAGQAVLAELGDRIAAQAQTPFDIRVRAVDAPMVNAFALPGGAVLITDDMIREAKGPDELAAVVAHEIAHVEHRHVMQAVWRDLGIGMLLDLVVGGGTGAGQQAVLLAGQASSLSYDRAAEQEADARGQILLHGLGLSSQGMATFFERLGEDEAADDLTAATEFMNTHPDSRRRAQAARTSERPGAAALTPEQWQVVRSTCTVDSEGAVERLRRRLGLGDRPALPNQGDQVSPD